MFELTFRTPWLLLFALAAPLVFLWASGVTSALRYSSLRLVDQAPRSFRARLAWLPALLMTFATVLLAIALSGPRTPDAETKVSREGIAIMMAVDRSGSMQARDMVAGDVSVDRLTAVKRVFREFVLGAGEAGRGRADDTVGLVTFARYADSICPLTLDHGNLVSMVEDLQIVSQQAEDGTAIGEGLALAVERLRRNQTKSRVVILLTDGVNNTGTIDPIQAAQLAVDHHIKVYCIGAGTNGLAPFPALDPFTGRTVLRRMTVEIDEATLEQIADMTGGRYFRATDQDALAGIYQQIDQLERTEVTEVRYLQYSEHYVAFVLGAMGLVVSAMVANGTVFRRLP